DVVDVLAALFAGVGRGAPVLVEPRRAVVHALERVRVAGLPGGVLALHHDVADQLQIADAAGRHAARRVALARRQLVVLDVREAASAILGLLVRGGRRGLRVVAAARRGRRVLLRRLRLAVIDG